MIYTFILFARNEITKLRKSSYNLQNGEWRKIRIRTARNTDEDLEFYQREERSCVKYTRGIIEYNTDVFYLARCIVCPGYMMIDTRRWTERYENAFG